MQQLEKCLQQLKVAVNSRVKDQSLVSEFSACLQTIKMDQNLVHPYCRVLFCLYDLSNDSFFLGEMKGRTRVQLDEMALSMKMCVLRMLSRMVMFFNDHPDVDQPLQLARQSLQIMILMSRVFLDRGKIYLVEIKQIYPLCMTFYDAFPQELPLELHLIHCVNIIELLKFNVDGGGLDILQFRRLLQSFFARSKSYNGNCNYVEFVQCIAFEVVLKLLKRGAREQAGVVTPYLTQKMMETVDSLTNLDVKIVGEDNPLFKVSPFYEMYMQIKNSGIGNISQERLRLFISNEENFKDVRLFDVVALTGETLPLEIWFEINLSSKVRNDVISNAYRCFLFVVDSALESQSNESNSTEFQVRFQADEIKLGKLLKLAQVVMLNLLSERKEQGEPLINILKRLIKILVQMVISLYGDTQVVREYAQKIQLICSKHSLGELSRSINCVSFYYELVMGVASEESYGRFTKMHLLDKSSNLFKVIKSAYEFQSGRYQPSEMQRRELLSKQPYLGILFQKDIRASAILKLNMSCFSKLPEKYEVYFLLIHGYLKEDKTTAADLVQLATHMEECLIISEYASINRLDMKYLADLEKIWLKVLQNEKYSNHAQLNIKGGIVLLYLGSLRFFLKKILSLNIAILLNRYSRIVKILSLVMEEISSLESEQHRNAVELYQYLSKLILSWSLQKLKMRSKQQQQESTEAGFLVLIDLLHQFVEKHQSNAQAAQFFKFIRFQIMCLSDSVSENEISCEKNIKLLKLYCSSIFISKGVKLKILRRLIREDLMKDSRHASLADLSELIQLTEDNKEKKLYAEYMIRSFGEEGRKYLLLHCSINSDAFNFLESLGDGELDYF